MPLMEKGMRVQALDFNSLTPDELFLLFDFLNDYVEMTSTQLDTWFIPKNFVMGAGLTLGYKTVIGPVEVQLSKSNIVDSWNLFVNVGYWF